MNAPPTVPQQDWETLRQKLLVREKELTRARDALAAERRRMPRMAVEKDYRFDGPHGAATLLDLFEGRRQLIVYRFFFEPGVGTWPEGGCVGCSMMADQDANRAHLNARDTTLAYASRAPQPDIERLKGRMGWDVPWYTITDSFDADFGVDEWHGTNVFFREGDRIFRTYFVDNRGDEALGSTFSYLDLTALGRQESWEDSPEGYPQTGGLRVVEEARRVRVGHRPVGRPPRGEDRREQGARAPLRGRRDVIAHVGGVPLEELVPTLAGAGSALLMARAWISLRLRREGQPRAGARRGPGLRRRRIRDR